MDPAPVFEDTYQGYLSQLSAVDFQALQEPLGTKSDGDELVITLFNRPYRVSGQGIADPKGRRPDLGVCVVIFKYLLMGAVSKSTMTDWVTYKDFRDAGPLIHYFNHTVEGAIARIFEHRPLDLAAACERLGGTPFKVDWAYHIKYRLMALPKLPMGLLFNDSEEGFGAQATLLFQRNAESYLDMESVAMLGSVLVRRLEQLQAS